MCQENVVSIYSRCKPIPVRFSSIEEASAAAAVLRKYGYKVRLIQEDDERFVLLAAA